LILHLERLIPIHDAAKLLGLSETRLRELVQAGTIKGAILPGGDIGVSENAAEISALNENLMSIKRSQFEHVHGSPITVTEASKKYDTNRATILMWVRQKYIRILTPGYRMEIDEADVAYCAAIHAARKGFGGQTGAPLLDSSGDPYLLKHPKLSEYRRRKKESVP